MPAAFRLGDLAQASADAHSCPKCPHQTVGPAIIGSPNVNTNSMPAVRFADIGIAAVCCGPNMWTAARGSATVYINGRAAIRTSDPTIHCGGTGQTQAGSPNVNIGP